MNGFFERPRSYDIAPTLGIVFGALAFFMGIRIEDPWIRVPLATLGAVLYLASVAAAFFANRPGSPKRPQDRRSGPGRYSGAGGLTKPRETRYNALQGPREGAPEIEFIRSEGK
jgi:hypothetical protein